MKQRNKAGNWRELVTLRGHDLFWLDNCDEIRDVALQITYARYGYEIRYSHVPGVIDEDGNFRAVQYLHDRNVRYYIELLSYAELFVTITKKLSPDVVAMNPSMLKTKIQKELKRLDVQPAKKQEKQEKQKKNVGLRKPGFGASIGEMIKAKQG